MYTVPEKLNWSLVVATYKRETILPRCLRLAAQQTLLPKEIIVVDASPYWEKTRAQIMQDIASQYPMIEWKYVQAKRTSLPAQRNQGIGLATAEVLFLIDDDSLMYLDCAEEIMKIYELDTEHKVVGVGALEVSLPPQNLMKEESKAHQLSSTLIKRGMLTQFKHKLKEGFLGKILGNLEEDRVLPPYDSPPIKHIFPETLKGMKVHQISFIGGCSMTFRRDLFKRIHFAEILENYAAAEDIDFSYRAARFGAILRNLDAQLYHDYSPGGRLSRFTVIALALLNFAVLHRVYNSSSFKVFRKRFPKGRGLGTIAVKQTIKDLLVGRWLFPSTRGVLFAFWHYKEIFSKSPEELHNWYPDFQKKLIGKT